MSTHLKCRCEEITADEIQRAIEAGARTVNDVKRATRAGMGVCQGIFCVAEIAKTIYEQTGISLDEISPLTARPPVRAIPVVGLTGTET